jgi:NADPH:quinone reductase-like Zn-dependent oxidoreductase
MAKASVLTSYGSPDVLVWSDIEPPAPGPGQIRLAVRAAGVSPTDLKIRRGDLQAVFPLPSPAVLGFEAAGVVDALGPDVTGTAVGDEVAALLPRLGGYGSFALASAWAPKPPSVSWADAAALPSSAEAAVGTLDQLGVSTGDTLLILGGAGSVGLIAVQLALARGAVVIAAAGPADEELLTSLGATFIRYGAGLRDRVSHVDAVLDAAGKGGLADAVALAGGTTRVITLADEHAADLGVRLSAPTPSRAPHALATTLPLLAAGTFRLRAQELVPASEAAEAHRLLESGEVRRKVVLTF